MSKLHIGTSADGKPFRLPLDLITQSVAILAKRRVGKSYTSAVICEELLKAQQQVVIIDPTGAHWGMRSSADGKAAGFPIVVIGGDHADLPLDEHAGETLARAIVERRFSAIIDLSLLRKGAANRFMGAFLETLYRLNREAMHLIIDEADLFSPQKSFGDEARTLGAMEDIVRRGGIRGIGATLITQRPAVISKNVLTQCEVLVTLRLVHPKDIAAVMDWVQVHADPEQAKAMLQSLPTLPVGNAWVWSPGWGDIFERVSVRRRETFDSGATPKAGERIIKPKVLAPVDLETLGAEIKAAAEQVKANDPAALRRQIADLQRQLAAPRELAVDVQALEQAEARGYERGRAELSDVRIGVVAALDGAAAYLQKALAHAAAAPESAARHAPAPAPRRAAAPPPPAPARPVNGHGAGDAAVGQGGLRRILISLAQRPGLTNRQIGVRAGMSSSSGTFSTYLSKARASGWIRDESDRRFITAEGRAALGSFDPLPTGPELLRYWLDELGGGAARILRVAADAYPKALSNSECGALAEISHASGTFSTYLSKLRTLELITGRGEIRASEEFFQ